jgi:hypothetical protein
VRLHKNPPIRYDVAVFETILFAICTCWLVTTPLLAEDSIWAGGSGHFYDSAQWRNGLVPDATDAVFFKESERVTIGTNRAIETGALHIRNGDYIFDLAGQNWINTGAFLRIGDGDTANWQSRAVFRGGTLDADGYLELGVFANDVGSSLTLTNGHVFTSKGPPAIIGRAGTNAALIITGGARLQSSGLVMATRSNGGGHSVTVEGPGSAINLQSEGRSGQGQLQIGASDSDNNTFTIRQGATVRHDLDQSGAPIIVGVTDPELMNGSGNTLLVTGGGSRLLSHTAILTVRGGRGAESLGNTLEVSSGGELVLEAIGASLEIRHANTLRVNGGRILLGQGSLSMTHSDAQFEFSSGKIVTQSTMNLSTTRTSIGDGIGPAGDASYQAIRGDGTHNFNAGGGLHVRRDGALTGDGIFIGAIDVEGLIAPGTENEIGLLRLQEDLRLQPGAVTRIKVKGFEAGAFDQIKQFGSSSIELGGTLIIDFAGNFDAVGAAQIFDFDNLSGVFAKIETHGLRPGLTARFDNTSGELLIEPEIAGRLSTRISSRTVDSEMRRIAQTNVARYTWAQDRVTNLRERLVDYLSAEDRFLWEMLPAQNMPRILYAAIETPPAANNYLDDPFLWPKTPIRPVREAPPGSEALHFEEPPAVSRGFGRKWHFHIDPFNHPWQVQSRGSGRWYPSNDLNAYYRSGLDGAGVFQRHLADPLFLEPATAGGTIDDGTGHLEDGTRHVFAAHYAFRVWQEATHAIRDLAELYSLTGDPEAAHKAGILLLRAAEVYPQMFYSGDPRNPTALRTGGVQDYIWENWTVEYLSLAYDQVFDALVENLALGRFLASQHGFEQQQYTPRQVAGFIEDRLLRDFAQRLQERRIIGNPGMPQLAMTAVAIGLDDPSVSPRLLDWLFQEDGGRVPEMLIDKMTRDGLGIEAGLGYASIPANTFFRVQQLLAAYTNDPRKDLIARFPKFANALAAGENVRVHRGSFLTTGDAGRPFEYGEWGVARGVEMAVEAYRREHSATALREVYFATRGNPARLPRDIFSSDPEGAIEGIATTLREMEKPGPLPSYNSGGYGQAVLQGGSLENPVSFALNYGPMSWNHGHGDRLGLHIFAHEAAMTADLGYPTFASRNAERIGWSSHSASHNTLTVDNQSIPFEGDSANFSGKTRLFATAGPIQMADIDSASERTLRGLGHNLYQSEATRPYEQATTYRRVIAMVDAGQQQTYGIDLFWARGGSVHRLTQNGGSTETYSNWTNWRWQAGGTALGSDTEYGVEEEAFTWDNPGTGLSFLDQVARADPVPNGPFWVEWPIRRAPVSDSATLRIHDLTAGLDASLTARGQSPRGGPDLRYWLRERRGTALASQFVSVLEPYRNAPFIKSIRRLPVFSEASGFAVALEIEMEDGRRDRILISESGGRISTADGFSLRGRLGWARYKADGTFLEASMIEADQFDLPDRSIRSPLPAALTGIIESIDQTVNDRVRLKLGGNALPPTIVGATIIIDNQTRSDASYRIRSVLGDNWIDIGRAAIAERHIDPEDYSKGLEKTIRVGDPYRIGLTHRTSADSDTDGLPDAWEFDQGVSGLTLLGANDGASSDFDGDGASDADEWQAGTDPKNPASRFTAKLTSGFPSEGSLTWQSQENRLYRVWHSPNLQNWSPASEYLEGTNASLLFPLPKSLNNSGFWRIEVKPYN